MTIKLQPRDGSASYHKITEGRRWIGRVYPKANGRWGGKIGQHEVDAATANEAFDEVGARYFGKANVAELRAANAQVRSDNKVRRQRAAYAVHEMLRGNFTPLDEMLGLPKK